MLEQACETTFRQVQAARIVWICIYLSIRIWHLRMIMACLSFRIGGPWRPELLSIPHGNRGRKMASFASLVILKGTEMGRSTGIG